MTITAEIPLQVAESLKPNLARSSFHLLLSPLEKMSKCLQW